MNQKPDGKTTAGSSNCKHQSMIAIADTVAVKCVPDYHGTSLLI